MNGAGEFTLTQMGERIPLTGSPPCWQCPKHPTDAPAGSKVPLPADEDFGRWFGLMHDWFTECRACGFPSDLHGTGRQVAAAFDQMEREVERGERRKLIQLLVRRDGK